MNALAKRVKALEREALSKFGKLAVPFEEIPPEPEIPEDGPGVDRAMMEWLVWSREYFGMTLEDFVCLSFDENHTNARIERMSAWEKERSMREMKSKKRKKPNQGGV